MKEITVTFTLTEEQEQRLEGALRAAQSKGWFPSYDVNRFFQSLMLLGSFHDINSKLDYAEMTARGIKPNDQMNNQEE